MDLGSNGELIFEDRTEAAVAAELLENAGRADLVEQFAPPLSANRLSFMDFARKQRDERKGIINDGIHIIDDLRMSAEAINTLIQVSNTNFPLSPQKALRKRDYMGSKLLELKSKSGRKMDNVFVFFGDVVILEVPTDPEPAEP